MGNLDELQCKSPQMLHHNITKLFPKIKLIKSSKKQSGNILITLLNNEEALKVIAGWQANYLGNNTTVSLLGNKPPPNASYHNCIIMKNIPIDIIDSALLSELKEQYPSIKSVNRFVKDGKQLPVLKAEFDSLNEKEHILINGCYIGNLFFIPEDFVHVKKPLQCFKCYKFGHISTTCRNSTRKCSNCSEAHDYKDCKSNVSKCLNCCGSHASISKSCPIYETEFKKCNKVPI